VKSHKQRAEERRREKLVAIAEQIEAGSLTVREMTAEERAQNPPRARTAARRRR
jgi:hypothetical protein